MRSAIVYGWLFADGSLEWPGRNQLMLAMSRHAPVVLLRQATGRQLGPLATPRVERLDRSLYLMTDALALRSNRVGRHLGIATSRLDGRAFRHALGNAGLSDYVLWLTAADPALARALPASGLVYDCADPCFIPELQDRFDREERFLARRASVVFASAQSLFARMRALNPNTHLLPNAAPIRPLAESGTRPGALAGRSGPVAGYLGTIDSRFASGYVYEAAIALSDITFAVVGRVTADQEANVAELRALPNVLMPGPVDTPTGEAYVRAFDVGLIPFTATSTSDAVNPVKMWMYLAAGKPVVATWIAECRDAPFVAAGRTPSEFADLIRRALATGTADEQRRRDYAAANTWTERATTAARIMTEHGLLR